MLKLFFIELSGRLRAYKLQPPAEHTSHPMSRDLLPDHLSHLKLLFTSSLYASFACFRHLGRHVETNVTALLWTATIADPKRMAVQIGHFVPSFLHVAAGYRNMQNLIVYSVPHVGFASNQALPAQQVAIAIDDHCSGKGLVNLLKTTTRVLSWCFNTLTHLPYDVHGRQRQVVIFVPDLLCHSHQVRTWQWNNAQH